MTTPPLADGVKGRIEIEKFVVSEFDPLDGVIEDPAMPGISARRLRRSDQGPRRGGQVKLDEALSTKALLPGRRSYEFVAAWWPLRDGALADGLNNLPKYVVSSTLENLGWNNSTVLGVDVVDEVSKLRQRLNGDIVIYGSAGLVPMLMEHDLMDELRLMIYPVRLGSGERPFGTTSDKKWLFLLEVGAGAPGRGR